MIPMLEPVLAGNESAYLQECVSSTFVSSVGPFVNSFEQQFADVVQAPHAVAVASGTAALHLALLAAGVGQGDHVLVSDLTFIATANPIRYCGATPVCVDVDAHSWNADPGVFRAAAQALADAGTPAKAAIIVHLYGMPAPLHEIKPICDEFAITLIEDAAESLGSSWNVDHPSALVAGKHTGTVGDIGCFSFNGNKIVTAGGGGMIVTDNQQYADYARHLSTQAKVPGAAYIHDAVGYNYRLTNIAAAVGLAQLEQLSEFLQAKRAIIERYQQVFCDASAGLLQTQPAHTTVNNWLPSFTLPAPIKRDELQQALANQGIQTRPVWPAIAEQPSYAAVQRFGGSVADAIAQQGLSLPASVSLTAADQERVITAIQSFGGRS